MKLSYDNSFRKPLNSFKKRRVGDLSNALHTSRSWSKSANRKLYEWFRHYNSGGKLIFHIYLISKFWQYCVIVFSKHREVSFFLFPNSTPFSVLYFQLLRTPAHQYVFPEVRKLIQISGITVENVFTAFALREVSG